MFSVSASPFNSPSRQLYGGWALGNQPGQAGKNIWGQKTYYEMAAKYAPEEKTRKEARAWLRWWREFSKKDPSYKKRLRLAGKPYWKDAIMPSMTDEQKAWIWQQFLALPFTTDLNNQRTSAFLRHAPYWNHAVMNARPEVGIPYIDADEGSAKILPLDTPWRTTEQLEEAFKKIRSPYGPLTDAKEAEFLSMLPDLPVKVKAEGMQ